MNILIKLVIVEFMKEKDLYYAEVRKPSFEKYCFFSNHVVKLTHKYNSRHSSTVKPLFDYHLCLSSTFNRTPLKNGLKNRAPPSN